MPAEGKDLGPGALTQAQQRRADQRTADQDRTLAAMHQLDALGAAAPDREQAWLGEVRRALGVLGEAAQKHPTRPSDSLLPDVARTQPWVRNGSAG
jgi:aminoglycoside phosphotransferase (APT) family kinase protein